MTVRRLFFSRARVMLAAFILPALMIVAANSVKAQDTTDFFLRLNQLENQVRELSGIVERLEHENRRLQDQLNRFQEDVEFRFQEKGAGGQVLPPKQKRSGLESGTMLKTTQTTTPASPASTQRLGVGEKLPTTYERDPARAPYSNTGSADVADAQTEQARPLDLGAVADIASRQNTAAEELDAAQIPSVAATVPGDPRVSYEDAQALMRRQQYGPAEMAFRQFLQSHPRDRLAADAVFNLGETYFFRGRYREAAEQYLKLSTTYSNSPLVPESMLKLGMSLDALGARDQACATFSETAKKFPDASTEIKAALSRARSRANCA